MRWDVGVKFVYVDGEEVIVDVEEVEVYIFIYRDCYIFYWIVWIFVYSWKYNKISVYIYSFFFNIYFIKMCMNIIGIMVYVVWLRLLKGSKCREDGVFYYYDL